MRLCAPLVSLGPLNGIILDLNKPYIIRNGTELGDLEYLPTKTKYTIYLQNMDACTSHIFRPFKRRNSRLKQVQDHKKQWRIDLPRLPAHQTENVEYLQNADTRASRLLGPIKLHYNTF